MNRETVEEVIVVARWRSPLPEELTTVEGCVHCQTVTWAGNAACGCEFGRLAVDDAAADALLVHDSDGSPGRLGTSC
jgi:hypothetical protein